MSSLLYNLGKNVHDELKLLCALGIRIDETSFRLVLLDWSF